MRGEIMKRNDLSGIPLLVKEGIISQKQGIDSIAIFITKNPAVFSLNNFSEDFISEVVLSFIEKGAILFNTFDEDVGSFFTYLFTFLQNIVFSIKKKNAKSYIKENITMVESINSFSEKEEAYSNINYGQLNRKVPFNCPITTIDDLKIAFNLKTKNTLNFLKKNNCENELIEKIGDFSSGLIDKTVLVLALKSAFFISDEQIELVSKICGIDKDILFAIIQQLRNDIYPKMIRKREIEERRNKAYFQHKKYLSQIKYLQNDDNNNKYEEDDLSQKYKNQTKNWQKINSRITDGYINLRPTNKSIADILGICERQVSYYITYAKNLNLY